MDPSALQFLGKYKISAPMNNGSSNYLAAYNLFNICHCVAPDTPAFNYVFAVYQVKMTNEIVLQQLGRDLQSKDSWDALFVGGAESGGTDFFGRPLFEFFLQTLDHNPPMQFKTPSLDGTYSPLFMPSLPGYLVALMGANGNPIGAFSLSKQYQTISGMDWQFTLVANVTDNADLSLVLFNFWQGVGFRCQNANFDHADLTNSRWGDIGNPSLMNGAQFPGANLNGAVFDYCEMQKVSLAGAGFSHTTSFINANLSGAIFDRGAQLSQIEFAGANLNRAQAAGVKLCGADLIDAVLDNADLTSADFTGAKFDYQTSAKSTLLDKAVLRGVTYPGSLKDASLKSADMTKAVLTNADLSGAKFERAILADTDFASSGTPGTLLIGTDFTGVDLTTSKFDAAPHFSTDPKNPTIFESATLRYDTLGLNWSYLVLSEATILNAPSALSSKESPLNAIYANISGMNLGVTAPDLSYAIFTSAIMGDLDLSGANLTGAHLQYAQLFNTSFEGAILDSIDGSGAQFGGLSELFSLPQSAQTTLNGGSGSLAQLFMDNGKVTLSTNASVAKTTALWLVTDRSGKINYTVSKTTGSAEQITVYASPAFEIDLKKFPNAESDLDNNNTGDVATIFAAQGIVLSVAKIALQTASWQVQDQQADAIYTVRQEMGATTMGVYTNTSAATLANAYMPNAVLKDATLFGVNAQSCHLYGDNADLSGSILEQADFSNANLSTLNLQQAQMQGVKLTGAMLINTKLTKANLTCSTTGSPASLIKASLQGADFTDALLFGADMTGAAVSVTIDEASVGVYLFALDSSAGPVLDASVQQYSLNADGDQLKFLAAVEALDTSDLGTLRQLWAQGEGPTLSDAASINSSASEDPDSMWRILVNGKLGYLAWSMPDPNGFDELYVSAIAPLRSLNNGDPGLYSQYVAALNTGDQAGIVQKALGSLIPVNSIVSISAEDGSATMWQITVAANSISTGVLVATIRGDGTQLSVWPQFSLNPTGDQTIYSSMRSALENDRSADLKSAFAAAGYTLDGTEQIKVAGTIWQITDGANQYTAWSDVDDNLNLELMIAPSLSSLRESFGDYGLRWQAAVSSASPDDGWRIDNDSNNPQNMSVGYSQFRVVHEDSGLAVYGTELRVKRLGDANRFVIQTETFQATQITAANLSSDTICPNGYRYQTNLENKLDLNHMMRGPNPPKPPTCVPSPNFNCPTQSMTAKYRLSAHGRSGRQLFLDCPHTDRGLSRYRDTLQ